MSTRLAGHELLNEGAPYTKHGRNSYPVRSGYGTGGKGHGKCSCGALSDWLESGSKRKAWHRAHKEEITEALACTRRTQGKVGPRMSTEIIDGMSNAEYHRHAALGSTSLKTLATRTPAHWKWESEHPVHKDAYDIGTLAHSLILEQDESGVVVIDEDDKRGKKWTEPAADARQAGKIPVLTKEWADITGMRDSVMAHPVAGPLFAGHRAEASVFWEEDGLALKCRPDAWQPGKLIDLKTTRTADPNEFGRTAAEFGYHQSAAHYIDGVKAATGEELPFKFILVEKTAPYFVSVVELDVEAVDLGRQLNDRAKRIYRECTETGRWPGYTNSEPVNLPMWAIYKAEDLLGIGSDDIEMSI